MESPIRLNKFIAQATGMSRRAADSVIEAGRVTINDSMAKQGSTVTPSDRVTLDGSLLLLQTTQTILFHKPVGYVVSRDGQGSKTIYDILPAKYHQLKPIGRLDKDSSGLLLLTNDGSLAQQLSHPSYQKTKAYEVTLKEPLAPLHRQMITDYGIHLEDGRSKLGLERLHDNSDTEWRVTMHEGRNRQIRRTFHALGYTVTGLHRTSFGSFVLPPSVQPGEVQVVGTKQETA